MFDIVMYNYYRGVLITTISTWVILRTIMGEVVCATEATQHIPLVFAVYYIYYNVIQLSD